MKADQQGNPYFAYAINRATFNTHWFVMFRSLAFAQAQILPVPGYFTPLGVSLVIDEQTANPTFYVIALVQSIEAASPSPQRMYLFKRPANSSTWQRTQIYANHLLPWRELLPHIDASVDGQGLIHIAYTARITVPGTSFVAVRARELIVNPANSAVLHNRLIDGNLAAVQTGIGDKFNAINLTQHNARMYASVLTPGQFVLKTRPFAQSQWHNELTLPQAVGGDLHSGQIGGVNVLALAAAENGSFAQGGDRLTVYLKGGNQFPWLTVPVAQGETYFSPNVFVGDSSIGPKMTVAASTIDPVTHWNYFKIYSLHSGNFPHWSSQILEANPFSQTPVTNLQVRDE